MPEILLVEDDPTLGMSLEVALANQGHDVTWCTTLRAAGEAVLRCPPDLIVLDLGLPDGDGMDFCRAERRRGVIAPILILTARATVHARVEGLTGGADDYLTKPFELDELLARIEALMRRQRWHGSGDAVTVGRLRLDFRRYEAFDGDEAVALTELEFKVLRYLLDRPGEVVTREELLSKVWGVSPSTKTRTVDVFVSRLRRLIEEDGARPKHLLNVRGVGYRLVGVASQGATE
jgi:DNA-binding response OmpR family regulator